MKPKVIEEKDKIRGLVPARGFGAQDKAYQSYLSKLNPRANNKVQVALAASDDPRYLEFLERINEPRYDKVSMASIAKACNITMREFNEWWQKESAQQAIAIAQMGSLDLTEDMVADAASRQVVCERCDGLGWIAAPNNLPLDTPGYRLLQDGDDPKWIRNCPNGCVQGKVRKPGDTHSRNMLLEMSGLANKGKNGPALTINFGGASHPSALSSINDAMTIDLE